MILNFGLIQRWWNKALSLGGEYVKVAIHNADIWQAKGIPYL